MNLLRPKKLVMEGFMSFKKRTEITFPDSGVVLINGKYKDQPVSSGSGKSSILHAMAFALDYCSIPATKLKNWDSKKLLVELTLTDGTNVYEITRSPSFGLTENGVEYKGTSTGARDRIIEILKTSPELTKALTYRQQRTPGKFLTLTDSGIKEFLSNLLPLKEVEAGHISLKDELSRVSSDLQVEERSLQYIESQPQDRPTLESVEEARKALEEAEFRLETLKEADSEEEGIRSELVKLFQERKRIEIAESTVFQCKAQNVSIRTEVVKLDEEIKTISKNLCPTCMREWNAGDALIKTKQQRISTLLEQMKANIQSVKASEPLIDQSHKETINVKINELNSRLGGIRAPLQDALAAKDSASRTFALIKAAVKSFLENQERTKVLKEKITSLNAKHHILEHAEFIVSKSGFMGVIFGEVLEEISRKTNEMMSYIPNIDTFTIGTSSESVTKTGKVNKKIGISFNTRNKVASYDNLSGGQKTSAELCSDLAVGETIRSRSGSNLGWVALDEAMDGLGPETKLAALDVIRAKVNGLIIVVDHETTIKEAFDKVIEIEYDGKESRVVSG